MWRASLLSLVLLLAVFAATCDSDGLKRIDGQVQHKIRFEKVSVYYRETQEGLSAVRVTD